MHLSGPGASQGKLPGPLKSGFCVTQGQKETKRDTPRLKWPFFSNNPPSLGSLAGKCRFAQAPAIRCHLPAGAAEGARVQMLRGGPLSGSWSPGSLPAARTEGKLSGAGALPSPARLTSCPWRRRGGTRCPEPRRTASCRLVPEGGGDVDAGERGAVCSRRQQRGLNAPPAGPPRSRGPRPGAPAPLHLTALRVRSSANRLPVLRVSANIGFSPASPRAGDPQRAELLGQLLPRTRRRRSLPGTESRILYVSDLLDPLSQLLQRSDPSCSEKWWLRHRRETDARSRAVADTR